MQGERFDVDLFGDERPIARAQARPVSLNLFDSAAEVHALASGRPRSQERTELLAPAGLSCLCGRSLSHAAARCACEGA
jgi:hypothetical protein